MKKILSYIRPVIIIQFMIVHIPLSVVASDHGVVINGFKDNGPASVDIISVSDSDRQVKTLSGILESRAGVQVMRYGTAGSYSSIYVRGTNANQLAVYIDGIPLSDSVFGEINFENIPLDSIDRVEIYKNSAPLNFASPGIGGVINLVTKKNRHTNETGASVTVGSFDTYRMSAFYSSAGDLTDFLVTGSASLSSGNFPFKNDNGTKFNLNDNFNDTRKNNEYKSGNATVRYSRSEGNTAIDVLSDFFTKNQNVASYNNTASGASLDTMQSLNNVRITSTKIAGLPLSEQFSVFANARRDIFDDLQNEIGLFAKKSIGTYISCGAGSYTVFEIKNIFQELSLSVQGQNEYYYLKNETGTDKQSYPPQKRGSLIAGVQDNISFFNGRIVITPQMRCEVRHDSFVDSVVNDSTVFSCDPQAGTVFWGIEDLLYLKMSYGLNHRSPGFSELFGNRGTVQGNQNLKDENSDSYNATIGITNADFSSEILQSFSIEYSYFRTRIKNIIIFLQNSQNTMKADNISAADITGHELSAQMTVINHLDLSCNATLQYAKDKSDVLYYKNNYLPHRPILEGGSDVKLFSKMGSIAYQYNYAGGNFRDRANSDSLYIKHRVYHTVTAVLTPRFDLTVTIEAKNIADNKMQDVAGYPLPGRSFTGSVQYIF